MFNRRPRPRIESWVLRDISFEVEPGETVGLIGENGAGKSTALKLMARTLVPTTGSVKTLGRVSALLELGVGFHPDLTGRENVFLNGSIMGLSRTQVRRRLDDIIAFAELERFIDVPVKHYSSGMYVRLGFAVAVHADPEILLIDEVLAVGDVHFQEKCLDRIASLHQQGVTIVQASHSMSQIADTCKRVFWIDDGVLRSAGDARQVIGDYLSAVSPEEYAHFMATHAPLRAEETLLEVTAPATEPEAVDESFEAPATEPEVGGESPEAPATSLISDLPQRWGDGRVLIKAVRLCTAGGQVAERFCPEDSMRIEIDYGVQAPIEEFPTFGVAIYRTDGVWCYGTNTALDGVRFPMIELPPAGTVVVDWPKLRLLQGEYTVDIAVHNSDDSITHDYIRAMTSFSVANDRSDQGVFRPDVHWQLVPAEQQGML